MICHGMFVDDRFANFVLFLHTIYIRKNDLLIVSFLFTSYPMPVLFNWILVLSGFCFPDPSLIPTVNANLSNKAGLAKTLVIC